jgi:hypothetical protein
VNQHAWLYSFAEPKLVEFAKRIELELPDGHVVIRESTLSDHMGFTVSTYDKKPSRRLNQPSCFTLTIGDIFDKKQARTTKDVQFTNSINLSIEILGRFREKVISTFDSPF